LTTIRTAKERPFHWALAKNNSIRCLGDLRAVAHARDDLVSRPIVLVTGADIRQRVSVKVLKLHDPVSGEADLGETVIALECVEPARIFAQ
jgi:hypothetical protein